MAYATYSDVEAKLQHITFSDTSDPTSTEVTTMLGDLEEQMDARFNALGIDVPITDTDKIKVVKRVLVHGVCAEVLRSLDMESESAAVYQKLYDDAMKNFEKYPAILETSQTYPAPGGSERGTPRFSRESHDW